MRNYLFDCERMKYPNTGPYHVCKNVAENLLKQKSTDEEFTFLIPPQLDGCFGNNASYYKLKPINKLYLPWRQSRLMFGTNRYDVWHITYQSSMYVPLNKKTKVVLTILDLNFLYEHPNDPKNKSRLQVIQNRVDRADIITCISDFVLNDVKTHLDLKGKPAVTVYTGCNYENLNFTEEPLTKPAKPFLLALGTVLPKKNFHVLPCLLKNNDFDLLIAGIANTDYKDKIIDEAKKHNVTDRVKFLGPVSEGEKNWYYKHCEAFLFPSIAEGFGLPVIEAMSLGKPVFTSTFTSLPEVGGKYAYYFTDFSPETMQQVFNDGMNNFRHDHPQDKIKEWAHRFTWENTAKGYLNLYRSLK